MALVLHWLLPTSDDSGIATRGHAGSTDVAGTSRDAGIDYTAQVALAAERLGYAGVLAPTGSSCEDAWITAAALLRETRRLRFIIALRPGATSPTLAAQQASVFQRVSDGRLMLNVVAGGNAVEQQRFGDWSDPEVRYDRADEFLTVLRGAGGAEPFDFSGKHYRVVGSTTRGSSTSSPPIYFGGSSDAAFRVAARHAEVYLAEGGSPAEVAEKIGRVRELADELERPMRFGLRLHVVTHDTSEEAWKRANRVLSVQRGPTAFSEMGLDLWTCDEFSADGAGSTLVGNHEQVAERIAEYHALGIDEFVVSGHPHLEETYQFGEGVMPLL